MLLSSLDRQVIASWRGNVLGRRKFGPRIAVLGNCQIFGVAYAMKLLEVDAEVDRFSIVSKSWTDIRTLARTLETYDYVFCQDFPPGYARGGASPELRNALRKAIWFPALGFSAFHPDLVLMTTVLCPTGPYHSALALFAYRAGLPPEAALRLFNREVFQALGYFDVWPSAAEALLDQGRHYDLDFGADFLRWARRGCFMYSINHPKAYVLYDVARQLLRKAGRPSEDIDFDTYAVDDSVRSYVFPVYPEIAEFYGVPGSYIFKTSQQDMHRHLGRFWDLRGYVEECYRVYTQRQPEHLVNERVRGWLDDPETSEIVRSFAGAGGRPQAAAA